MSVLVSMVAMIVVLSCWECSRFSSIPVYAERHDSSGDALLPHTPLQKTSRAWRDGADADPYHDPFVPKTVVRTDTEVGSPVPKQEPDRQNVLVKAIIASPRGRWAILEFENGERLIVMTGQVIAASSQVVTRITDREVTLSALEGKASPRSQPDRTYVLDQ